MRCPSLSCCLLRQMSLVSAAITAQLNINDSLAWQVLAGQRRGERGMTLDKTRDQKEKWWLYLTDSLLSLSTCVYVCVPSANSWLDVTVLLPCFSSALRRWTSLYSHCPSSFLPAFLTFLQVSAHVCKCSSVFICVTAYLRVFPSYTHVHFLERTSWTLMLATVVTTPASAVAQFSVFSDMIKYFSSVISLCFFTIRRSPCSLLLRSLTGLHLPLALRVVFQAYCFFLHLSFELLTPQLRGVKWYCWVDTAQIRLHIAHISEVHPFKGITLLAPSAPSPCIIRHTLLSSMSSLLSWAADSWTVRQADKFFLLAFLYCRAAGLPWWSRYSPGLLLPRQPLPPLGSRCND